MLKEKERAKARAQAQAAIRVVGAAPISHAAAWGGNTQQGSGPVQGRAHL